MEKLISMTAFVLEASLKYESEYAYLMITQYAEFLSQPLTLGMFVPVDEDGNVLEEPERIRTVIGYGGESTDDYDVIEVEEYKQAKSRVLFEGFYKHHGWLYFPNQVELIEIGNSFINWQDVEWLKNDSFQDIILTETAKKQIFG